MLGSTAVDINQVGCNGKTALFHAISAQHTKIVHLLLKYGADIHQASFVSYHRDFVGSQLSCCDEVPIITAARVGSRAIVCMLLEAGANPNVQSVCHAYNGGMKVANDKAALHFACEHANEEMVALLLQYHADVNIRDKQNELPLHIAVRCKQCTQQSSIIKALCGNDTDVNALNKIECSPLYLASFYGCNAKVEMLLSHGAAIDQCSERESSYGTALHIAAVKDRSALAWLLISCGARLALRNGQQYTPLHLNINTHSSSEIASLLVVHGADMDGVDKYGYTVLSASIRNMRLDCERLAQLAVGAGYDLRQDKWLQLVDSNNDKTKCQSITSDTPEIPIPSGRVLKLCRWLRHRQTNASALMDLCRVAIRKGLSRSVDGRSVVPALEQLPLPTSVKSFLLLKELSDDVSC